MEKQDLDQIVSAVTESLGARIDAIEAQVNSLAEGAAAEPPAPAETEEPEAETETEPEAEVTEEPEASSEPADTEPEAEPEEEPSNDLSAAGLNPTEIAEFRQYQADKEAAARKAEIRKEVDAALASKKHSITPAAPAKPSAKESGGDDPRAEYAKRFQSETGIDFDLAFAPLSKKERTLSLSETQMKNRFLRQHGPPKSAA